MALLEASACGCLCVSTDAGDHRKLMERTGGICVPVRDPEALANGVEAYLNLPEADKTARRKQAREAIISRYNVRDMAAQYDKVFADAALSRRSSRQA